MTKRFCGAVMAVALAVATLPVAAQTAKPLALGSARLGKAVMADGKSLAAGTYMLRVSDEKPAAVVGQTAICERFAARAVPQEGFPPARACG